MAASTPDPLVEADRAANAMNAEQRLDDSRAPCPLAARHVIEVHVVDERDVPLDAVTVELRSDNGSVLRSRTDGDGLVRFCGLTGGDHRLCLPTLDASAWEERARASLSAAAAQEGPPANWQPRPAAARTAPSRHVVRQGECISKLADRYGLLAETLWSFPDNAGLKESRKDPNVLNPGDVVVVPPLEEKEIAVSTGKRIELRRKGASAEFRVRFADGDEPRAGEPYLFSFRTRSDEVLADRSGQTDGGGFIIETIPPRAETAIVVLGRGSEQEEHTFDIGHLDPVDTLTGVQDRLAGLGYLWGATDGTLDAATRQGLRLFQRASALEVTGEVDDATRVKLKEAFGS